MPGESCDARAAARARFAAVLRARRILAGLTQRELAERSGVGVRTVRELEKARVRRPQYETISLLATALKLTPLDREGFVGAARPAATVKERPTLPTLWAGPEETQPSRAEAVEDLATLMMMSPVVILTGAPGAGKTSLAGAVARCCEDWYPMCVAWVIVQPQASPDEILAAVAAAAAVPTVADLPLRGWPDAGCLLVLDRVDQAPDAASTVMSWLLTWVPAMVILATSRHMIDLPGAVEWQVEPGGDSYGRLTPAG